MCPEEIECRVVVFTLDKNQVEKPYHYGSEQGGGVSKSNAGDLVPTAEEW